jgi:hypothetical protein
MMGMVWNHGSDSYTYPDTQTVLTADLTQSFRLLLDQGS